jgi:hypothetical protein
MATRLRQFICIATLVAVGGNLPQRTAEAAGLDKKGTTEAKEASQLYKQGHYEEAAQIFARLSVNYPDMEIFERNLGACFYYLHKPEPALSNLRRYLGRKKDIAPDDKAVVDRWIDEMEKLSAQNAAASSQPVVPPLAEPAAPAPAPEPSPVPPPPAEPAAPAPAAEPSPVPPPQPELQAVPVPPPAPADDAKPARSDLTGPVADPPRTDKPFYKTWWFWTGAAAIVVAGTVTAFLIAGRSSGPCSGASLTCQGVQ